MAIKRLNYVKEKYHISFNVNSASFQYVLKGDKHLLLSAIWDNFITEALTSLCRYFQSSLKFIDFPWYWMINFILESGKELI